MKLTTFSVEVVDVQPARKLADFSVEVVDAQPARALTTFSVDIPFIQKTPARALTIFSVDCRAKTPARKLLSFNISVWNKSTLAQRWEAVVMLNGVDITSRVLGDVSVSGQRGQNRTASFEIKNEVGTVNPDAFINQPVSIDYIQPDGRVDRIFTGFVETPTYQFESGRTAIVASTLKDKRLDAMTRNQLNALIGGRWSKHIFYEDNEGADYAADLLKTVPADLCVDANGVLRLVPWAVGAADFTLTGGDISWQIMGVTLQDAKSLVNSISVTVDYRYTRLRHRELDYQWASPGAGNWADYMAKPFTLAQKDLILSAVEGTGWTLIGSVQYEDVPTGGWYNVNGTQTGWVNPDAGRYAAAAQWSLASRFTQTITEKYTLTFKAPQSVEVWGDIPSSARSHGVVAEFSDDEWDSMDVYTGPDAAAVQSPNGDWIIDATDTAEGNRAEFELALLAILDQYRCELLNAHRKNYVDILLAKKLWAEIDIIHAVAVASSVLNCTAGVQSVTHSFSRKNGTRSTRLRLVLSRAPAVGSYSDSPLVVPAKPNTTDQAVPNAPVKLGVHLGNSYASPVFDETWTGYITNYNFYDKVATLQQYPTAFVVDTPAIADVDRDEREAVRAQSFDVLIPDDPLQIIKP
ncbi:hypothetical protein SAMN03080615_01676 [Amphritea atlantica]|uniref:Uncharacterized protein n=1 Tax=Amphritea atlantica TaxID=355243 RepID=A0A1H9GHK1_9GAMM|nr:hypothetical protein [Amphritea atlantica]SEQ49358.1 hypothetical protein SAMN03080615_01676 [Amphritea atlantica]